VPDTEHVGVVDGQSASVVQLLTQNSPREHVGYVEGQSVLVVQVLTHSPPTHDGLETGQSVLAVQGPQTPAVQTGAPYVGQPALVTQEVLQTALVQFGVAAGQSGDASVPVHSHVPKPHSPDEQLASTLRIGVHGWPALSLHSSLAEASQICTSASPHWDWTAHGWLGLSTHVPAVPTSWQLMFVEGVLQLATVVHVLTAQTLLMQL
jgi:hypothetical protein